MLVNVIDGDVHLVNPGCAAGGCFWGEHFRVVWAIVAVVLKSLTTIFSIALLVKLRQHQKQVISVLCSLVREGSEKTVQTICSKPNEGRR
jgi:hypothetical protein